MALDGRQLELPALCFRPELVPNGDNTYTLRPGKPVAKLTVQEAARIARRSIWTIYRLYALGYLAGERPSPNGILIYAESLQEHLVKTQDPDFWRARRNYTDG